MVSASCAGQGLGAGSTAGRRRSCAQMPAQTRRARSTRKPAGPRASAVRRGGARGAGRQASACAGRASHASARPAPARRARPGLVALGIFMGFVLYGGWDGGRVGHGLAVALGWRWGEARGLAPIALVRRRRRAAAGARAARTAPACAPAALCLFAAIMLALAAGTLGVSARHARAGAQWRTAFLQSHGGIAGQSFYLGRPPAGAEGRRGHPRRLPGDRGRVLLTGASLAAALRATGDGLMDTTRMLRSAAAHERTPRAAPSSARRRRQSRTLQPPDPAPEDLIVRATAVEAPSRDELLSRSTRGVRCRSRSAEEQGEEPAVVSRGDAEESSTTEEQLAGDARSGRGSRRPAHPPGPAARCRHRRPGLRLGAAARPSAC